MMTSVSIGGIPVAGLLAQAAAGPLEGLPWYREGWAMWGLVLATVAFSFLGDGLNDALNPRGSK